MQSITLIKSHRCIQLAHLYEHLVMRRINEYMFDKRLYKSIDYAANGTTFDQGGIILIEIDTYSDEASRYIDKLQTLPIIPVENKNDIQIALSQISTEESNQLHITSYEEMLKELQSLDQAPWSSIDSYTLLDTQLAHTKHKPIYLTDQPQSKPLQIQVSLTLDKAFAKDHRNLTPLFHEAARFSLLTASDVLAYRYGLYTDGLHSQPHLPSLVSVLLLPRLDEPHPDADEMIQITQKTMRTALSTQTIARFVKDYTNLDYRNRPHEAPNIERILKETGLTIGRIGWLQIATDANINLVLKHTSAKIKIGHQTATSPL